MNPVCNGSSSGSPGPPPAAVPAAATTGDDCIDTCMCDDEAECTGGGRPAGGTKCAWDPAGGCQVDGPASCRRACHLMAPPLYLWQMFQYGINRGCHQNDSLVNG